MSLTADQIGAIRSRADLSPDPTLARDVLALLDVVGDLRKVEIAVLDTLALAPNEYAQCIIAARVAVTDTDYAKNNGRAEMIRVFATGLADRAGIPVTDWEQIKRNVPADGVYRAAAGESA